MSASNRAAPTASERLAAFVEAARAGETLWLPDVREAFAQAEGGVPLVLRLRSFDGKTRVWRHAVPFWTNEEEFAFVHDYLCASVYNAMSACGGFELTVYTEKNIPEMTDLLAKLPEDFQLRAERRSGLGKVVSIANRMGRCVDCKEFSFSVRDISELPEETETMEHASSVGVTLRRACREAASLHCVGVDVGGTDIKLAASVDNRLIAVKEYDWNPASFPTAEKIIAPILLLTRLMRCCIAADGRRDEGLLRALRKDADDEEMEHAVEAAENRFGIGTLDAVGVSFPDIVLRDRIVGGETPKTDGLRRNPKVNYEEEFSLLGSLRERLLALCRRGGRCRIANDGNIAAFTAAVELACGGAEERIGGGVMAHSLGTDLGTGWLDERGEIPLLPLELYDLWLDLGSKNAAAFSPEDLRCTRNENSLLPGARRYLGQAAAYRLAWELSPRLLDGFTTERGGALRICTEPEDLRKPCLEHLMRLAAEGDAAAEEIFRTIGRNLAVLSREAEWLLRPKTDVRFLFGRFVKSERCFALLREGFAARAPRLRLENVGEGLAETPLMRSLAAREDATVAQFGQAVGSIFFAMMQEGDGA
ncbi:MAG: hypothetical protein IJU66_10110 [Oscillospiraceae bacterium]|nr:hypothetical protein [Oscillospiraceae bacterium]